MLRFVEKLNCPAILRHTYSIYNVQIYGRTSASKRFPGGTNWRYAIVEEDVQICIVELAAVHLSSSVTSECQHIIHAHPQPTDT